jgi:F-type H+-transporting ATPase subunit alpha
VLILFAGVNGYLDDLPVESCQAFEAELYRYVDASHPEIAAEIREKKAISEDLKARIEKMMAEFKQRFKAEHKLQ